MERLICAGHWRASLAGPRASTGADLRPDSSIKRAALGLGALRGGARGPANESARTCCACLVVYARPAPDSLDRRRGPAPSSGIRARARKPAGRPASEMVQPLAGARDESRTTNSSRARLFLYFCFVSLILVAS